MLLDSSAEEYRERHLTQIQDSKTDALIYRRPREWLAYVNVQFPQGDKLEELVVELRKGNGGFAIEESQFWEESELWDEDEANAQEQAREKAQDEARREREKDEVAQREGGAAVLPGEEESVQDPEPEPFYKERKENEYPKAVMLVGEMFDRLYVEAQGDLPLLFKFE